MAVVTKVGDGANTLFWKDRWPEGKNVQEIAPHVYALISKRVVERRSVQKALINAKWIEDIRGSVSLEALMDYLKLWDIISEVELQVGCKTHTFGSCPTQASTQRNRHMMPFFRGPSFSDHMRGFGNPGLHPNVDSLWWLVAHNRCWTADRLARRGLQHLDKCVLCDQEEEDIQHLLIGCVVARQVWFSLFHQIGFSQLAPMPTKASFDIWWENVEATSTGDTRKGLNSLVILGAWCI
jgi:hypothetical protein